MDRAVINAMGAVLTLVALCELAMTIAYLAATDFPLSWVPYAISSALCLEALVYYVFTGYIALRRVDTIAELIRMLFSIPVYFLMILTCALARRDLSKTTLLSQLIYFEFPRGVVQIQILVHECTAGLPCAALTALSVSRGESQPILGLCAVGVLSASCVLHVSILCWKYRSTRRYTHLVNPTT